MLCATASSPAASVSPGFPAPWEAARCALCWSYRAALFLALRRLSSHLALLPAYPSLSLIGFPFRGCSLADPPPPPPGSPISDCGSPLFRCSTAEARVNAEVSEMRTELAEALVRVQQLTEQEAVLKATIRTLEAELKTER